MKRILVLSLTVAAVVASGLVLRDVLDPPETFSIEQSYAFDVTDPEQLAGFSDYIVVARVTGEGTPVERTEAGPYTDFPIRIVNSLKGSPGSDAVVRQLGGQEGEDTFVLDDQPMLVNGRTYVLALTKATDRTQLTVVAGPLSANQFPDDRAQAGRVISAWRRAIAAQRDPEV